MTTAPLKLESRPATATAGLRLDVAFLIALSVVFAIIRWNKLESLWGDADRWIFEVYRGSTGEMPYRDFAWQYPPLAIALFSSALHLFGEKFSTILILLDLISAAIVFLTWDVARRLFPRPFPLLIAAALACAGASNSSNFALFSLQIYTPAIPVGMVGLLLLMREVIDYLKFGQWRSRGFLWASVGATIGLLSKPEFIVGVIGCLAGLSLSDRLLHFKDRPISAWMAHYGKLLLAAVGPSVLVYAGLAKLVGAGNLASGLGGYGLATMSCPWWPTGLGVFGAIVAIGYAVILAAVASLTRLQAFIKHYGSRYWRVWGMAAVAAILTLWYLPYCAEDLPVFQHRLTLSHTLAYFSSTGTVLLPVMWVSILLWGAAVVRLFQAWRIGTRWSVADSLILTALTGGVLMSLRGLFSGTMSQLSLVSVAAYPIWFVAGPYLLARFLERPAQETMPSHLMLKRVSPAVMILVAGFAILRFGGAFVTELRGHNPTIATQAGPLRLKDQSISPLALEYVAKHSAMGDSILDLAFGGAINFAERRPSPVFSTQITALAPSPKYLNLDLERIRKNPPRLVIANQGTNFQAEFGVCMQTGCTYPKLVWRSNRLACDLSADFPMLDYIRDHYEPRASFGDKIIYERKGPASDVASAAFAK